MNFQQILMAAATQGGGTAVSQFASWPPLIGAEMMVNGDCGSATGWTLVNAVIALGKLGMTSAAAGSGATNSGTDASSLVEDATYRNVFTADSFPLGGLKLNMGTTQGALRNTAGTFSEDIIATGLGGGDGWSLEAQATTTCSLDNFSVKSFGLLGVGADWTTTSGTIYAPYQFVTLPAGAITFDSAAINEEIELTGAAKTAFDNAVSSNTACSVTIYAGSDNPLNGTVGVKLKGGTKVDFSFAAAPGASITHTVTSGAGSGFELIAGADFPIGDLVRVGITL